MEDLRNQERGECLADDVRDGRSNTIHLAYLWSQAFTQATHLFECGRHITERYHRLSVLPVWRLGDRYMVKLCKGEIYFCEF